MVEPTKKGRIGNAILKKVHDGHILLSERGWGLGGVGHAEALFGKGTPGGGKPGGCGEVTPLVPG